MLIEVWMPIYSSHFAFAHNHRQVPAAPGLFFSANDIVGSHHENLLTMTVAKEPSSSIGGNIDKYASKMAYAFRLTGY
ncbi:MAG: hypothetical protein D9V47_03675 [Clostridia bacterium]|nr:MAG: hypothetical protein D9V47_03675 [Clostridia bacterium]